MVGDAIRVGAGAVRQDETARARGREVDALVAGPLRADDPQPREGGDQLRRDGRDAVRQDRLDPLAVLSGGRVARRFGGRGMDGVQRLDLSQALRLQLDREKQVTLLAPLRHVAVDPLACRHMASVASGPILMAGTVAER